MCCNVATDTNMQPQLLVGCKEGQWDVNTADVCRLLVP